ncbi:MAG: hypothetical protein KDC43_03190 [Saprospiraceae bacterium]|nr:hypothetical protein [Saprospiraceae bacterium]MCB0622939.1 hypothetical protein [Saprospiraceae bacterium]MCB0675723.1 hypothetical protein [Saprospiraceae bacterium]MCB0680542.1 hypothetical protein [Saprospiraceae bacterium]
MKKIVFPGLVAGVVLLIISYAGLYLSIQFFPKLVEEFYNPIFYPGEDRTLLYFIHPFVLSFALAWFWERFKEMFKGSFVVRGFELGIVYGVVATLPAMWITFSAINVSLSMVVTWFIYGLAQATLAGLIYAKMNP